MWNVTILIGFVLISEIFLIILFQICRITAPQRILSEALSNFQHSDDQVTLEASAQSLVLRNYIDNNIDVTKVIRSQIVLKPAEFDSYTIGIDTNITFTLKEFKALLAFAEALNLPLQINFETTGMPAVFIVHNGSTFEAHFVLATSKPESATEVSTQNTNVERTKRKEDSNIQGPVNKKPHLDVDISKHLDEDSHLFNFVDVPNDTDAQENNNECQMKENSNIQKELLMDQVQIIPASPTSKTVKNFVFKRCFESTFDPRNVNGLILAENSDSE